MIITKTSLRLSLLGGNTDFPKYFRKYGGACLTTTIDKFIYCIVKKRFDDLIYINYSVKEKVEKVEDIKHDLVREAMKLVGVKEGVEITFLSDIPSEGSGLGSSSSVVVGLLNALHAYKNYSVTPRQLAEEACHIEVDILKKPIGYQDQYAVAFGGLNLIEFDKKVTVSPINPYYIEDYLMLFYTGKTRNANKVLSKMKLNKKILDRNKELAYKGSESLGDEIAFGEYLNEYWELKRKLNKYVTNKSIDDMYKVAMDAGALGGKIVGAGNGGFLLLIVPLANKKTVRNKLGFRELPIHLSKHASKVIFDI